MSAVLEQLTGPEQLRELPATALDALAGEIRQLLIESVPRTGGHFGPNLGVVELTIALHRVFDSPRDAIVWDTGHQAYVHKLLTGRRDGFDQLRSAGGLSGYPSRAESVHDLVENSHASTALSYADGLTRAFAVRGEPGRAVVAVVGDGALTGGMCWEALNNIGNAPQRPLIVVLNDNGRSYSPTVGSLAGHLNALRCGAAPGSVFELFGLAYLGPVDGHDIAAVEAALRQARSLGRAAVVHCVTVKGKGCTAAETDEVDCLHSVSPPSSQPSLGSAPSWTAVLGDELVTIASERPDVVALTAAMLHPTGLHRFATRFPDRVFDVGIAEQHAVTTAAGLAMGGLHPVVCVYATFLNRAFDQVLMDVALHALPVTFVLDRAGVTGNDGPSHNGMWDLSLLGVVPGMRVAAPRDAARLRAQLREAIAHPGPAAVRFPKGAVGPDLPALGRIGAADVLVRNGCGGVLIVAAGACARSAVTAAGELALRGQDVTVVDPGWLLPVDPALVRAAHGYQLVLTLEENAGAGGFGDAFSRAVRASGSCVALRSISLGAEFLPHAARNELLRVHGLDVCGIAQAATPADRRGLLSA
ncbi:MAG TPA: 1-deoxy-D-xylulose-5-phosphate synthase [Pseudonocardiaceae bacterium]|nr:1-deoxy-D-xylulose-5-phosphate synthase [Pseudonocardiaceae bacterium]